MLFEIDHLTRYEYSVPVRLTEQRLHFLPREDGFQNTVAQQVMIDPPPTSRIMSVDEWGNPLEHVRFEGETGHLEVRSHIQVETVERPPPCWPDNLRLPIDYSEQTSALSPYLQPLEEPDLLQAFVAQGLASSSGVVPDFLAALNQAIHGFYHQGVRLDGAARRPAETLALGEGVCRDLTLLFMAACRQVGLASRFVSGYQQGDGLRQQRHLHAWAEVYLPPHGWLGYDPTHGEMSGSDHVAIAAAPSQEGTMPLSGGYYFDGAELTSTLVTDIHIDTR